MKYLCYILLSLFALSMNSCEELTDFDDPASVKKAKDRSEYVLLCDVEQKDGTLVYKMSEALYVKPGVKIPWVIGDLVSAPMLNASKSSRDPDRAVIFYEDFGGRIRPMETQLFYLTGTSNNDTSKLEDIRTILAQ